MRYSVSFCLLFGIIAAQTPKEQDDPKQKGKTPKVLDIEKDPPKPAAKPKEGPGVLPGPGVLVVGVRQLPELMSPSFARTSADRLSLDLLFESLVRPVPDSPGSCRYEPGLAAALPRVVSHGRAFDIVPDAVWADAEQPGRRVVAVDVLNTLDKIKSLGPRPGGELADWFGESVSDAPTRCRLTLRQGHPDPLSLMTFKVLPNDRPDDEAFARKPVGSGPFIYAGRVVEGERSYAVFTANPHFDKRASRKNLPQLKEIRFLACADPVADFRRGIVDLLLENTTAELAGLTEQKPTAADDPPARDSSARLESQIGTNAKVVTRPTRRIHYLAVNHVKVGLGGDPGQKLRVALAHAIQREAILDAVYRAGFKEFHKPLTGPFPASAWPCDPKSAGSLDDAALAGAEFRQLDQVLERVTLKFPTDDPNTAKACQLIQQQIHDLKVGLTLDLVPLPPADFRRHVLMERSYDLAYMQFEFRDDWFGVGGLLDPKAGGPGSRNVLDLRPSERFDAVLTRAQVLSEFKELRSAMHRLHGEFQARMPFIPLWCLDAHLVFRRGVEPTPAADQIDPQAVFSQAERWRVNR